VGERSPIDCFSSVSRFFDPDFGRLPRRCRHHGDLGYDFAQGLYQPVVTFGEIVSYYLV
jgi:hypothetical protein